MTRSLPLSSPSHFMDHHRRVPGFCVPSWWTIGGIVALWLCVAYLRGVAISDPCSPWHYGAKGNGVALDTKAIQLAIDTCEPDKNGIYIILYVVFIYM